MLSYTDGRDYLGHDTVERFEGWGFRLGGPSPSTQTLVAVGPDDQIVRLSVGNYVWHTRDRTSKAGMRQLETRRGRIAEMEECRDGEHLALVDFGEDLARMDVREIAVSIAIGEGNSEMVATTEWALEAPETMDFDDRRQMRWIDLLEETDIPEPDGVDDLTFERMSGRGSRKTVNAFLEGYEDGAVDHACGGVHHWKAAFVARYEGHIIGAIVLAPPQNGVLAAEREEIVISRIASHPVRPANMSSWLISKARDWAERAGYGRIVALAGVDGNRGHCYPATGFELEEKVSQYVDGNGNVWPKRRYVDDLDPETYADRDVPMPGEEPEVCPA